MSLFTDILKNAGSQWLAATDWLPEHRLCSKDEKTHTGLEQPEDK